MYSVPIRNVYRMKVNTYILQTVTYVFKANTNFWDEKKIVFWLSCSLHLLLIINIIVVNLMPTCSYPFFVILRRNSTYFENIYFLCRNLVFFSNFFLSFLRSKFICYLKKNKPPNSLPYIALKCSRKLGTWLPF